MKRFFHLLFHGRFAMMNSICITRKPMSLFVKIWNLWFCFNQKIRFLLVGGFNTVVSYILFLAFIWLLTPAHYQAALLWSWFFSSFTSYLAQKFFVWRTAGNYFHEYCRCLLTWSFAYLINALLLWFFVEKILWPAWLGQAVSICAVTFFTFVLFKYFAFARKPT